MSLWLKTCSLRAVFFKNFITQGDFIFYSGVEILQIKTTQYISRMHISDDGYSLLNKTNF